MHKGRRWCGPRPAQASCDILFLDLGPIHLDLLGLVLDVSQLIIDLDAQTGGGNLLGNLLRGLLGCSTSPVSSARSATFWM